MIKLQRWLRLGSGVSLLSLFLAACMGAPATTPTAMPQVLRLATTTSTQDAGLLDAILPVFEQQFNARVEVVAVGTGQALEIGARGDADVVLVHARAREDQFVADGNGLERLDVMYNDFILVGPSADSAGVKSLTGAKDAFAQIAVQSAAFVSRGDNSGTHTKEKSIWTAAGLTPTMETGWYFSIGQGMGETLQFANEKGAYTLTDRATWLAQQKNLPNLAVMVGGANITENADKALLNPYGVIAVNPEKHPGVNAALAQQFVSWLTALETQALIGKYGQDTYGQALFFPASAAWQAAHP